MEMWSERDSVRQEKSAFDSDMDAKKFVKLWHCIMATANSHVSPLIT